MERRKLIKLGNSSYAIALPKSWVTKSGLKKGDEVFVIKNSNGELILSSLLKKTNEQKGVSIDLSNKDDSAIFREVHAAYVKGYTLFHLKGENKHNNYHSIKKIFDGLLGVEVIENNQWGIVAKDFFNIEETNIENFIRRIDNNIMSMFSILSEGLKNGRLKKTETEEIQEADFDINKFYLLISRLFSLGMDNPSILAALRTDPTTLFHYWWLAFNLEHVGDNIKSISKLIASSKFNRKNSQALQKIFSDTQKIYNNSMESFYKMDKQLASKISGEGKQVWMECDRLARSDDADIAKLAIKLKEIENASYQNSKMVLYMTS